MIAKNIFLFYNYYNIYLIKHFILLKEIASNFSKNLLFLSENLISKNFTNNLFYLLNIINFKSTNNLSKKIQILYKHKKKHSQIKKFIKKKK